MPKRNSQDLFSGNLGSEKGPMPRISDFVPVLAKKIADFHDFVAISWREVVGETEFRSSRELEQLVLECLQVCATILVHRIVHAFVRIQVLEWRCHSVGVVNHPTVDSEISLMRHEAELFS